MIKRRLIEEYQQMEARYGADSPSQHNVSQGDGHILYQRTLTYNSLIIHTSKEFPKKLLFTLLMRGSMAVVLHSLLLKRKKRRGKSGAVVERNPQNYLHPHSNLWIS